MQLVAPGLLVTGASQSRSPGDDFTVNPAIPAPAFVGVCHVTRTLPACPVNSTDGLAGTSGGPGVMEAEARSPASHPRRSGPPR
jgi:hypothetical protein